jgi:hypothetical protein
MYSALTGYDLYKLTTTDGRSTFPSGRCCCSKHVNWVRIRHTPRTTVGHNESRFIQFVKLGRIQQVLSVFAYRLTLVAAERIQLDYNLLWRLQRERGQFWEINSQRQTQQELILQVLKAAGERPGRMQPASSSICFSMISALLY